MPPIKSRSGNITGDFDTPVGDALQYSASTYRDATRKRVSYTLTVYGRVGEERVPINFGDERKWVLHIPYAELDILPNEEATAVFLKQRFADVGNQAHIRCTLCTLFMLDL